MQVPQEQQQHKLERLRLDLLQSIDNEQVEDFVIINPIQSCSETKV
jgi:hypothetical protein